MFLIILNLKIPKMAKMIIIKCTLDSAADFVSFSSEFKPWSIRNMVTRWVCEKKSPNMWPNSFLSNLMYNLHRRQN
jgi:hypothetical protein